MIYDWDTNKAEINLKNHNLSFEEATLVFEDLFALELFDDEHSNLEEKRFIRLGLANGVILFVVYTMRGKDAEVYRIISARFVGLLQSSQSDDKISIVSGSEHLEHEKLLSYQAHSLPLAILISPTCLL